MKKILLILAVAAIASLTARADDAKPAVTKPAAAKPVPDKLTTCPVSGEKLGGDMGKP